jgi:ribosomal-protein-alanine N-acetyltransferase
MTAPVRVREAVTADLDSILSLERATATAPHWPRAAYSAILDAAAIPQRCLFVAHAEDSISGFAVGLLHPAASDSSVHRLAELESVAVVPSVRRSGIGRTLCVAVLDWCRTHGATEVMLEVRASSDGVIALYTGLGFIAAGRRPRYYRDPDDDALVMRLPLEDKAVGM